MRLLALFASLVLVIACSDSTAPAAELPDCKGAPIVRVTADGQIIDTVGIYYAKTFLCKIPHKK